MSSFFKIYIQKNSKNVVFKGNFNSFNKYKDLSDKIIEHSQNSFFIKNNQNLKNEEKFILKFLSDEEGNYFIPEEIKEGIYDEESFKLFKDKLISHGINDEKYKFYILKIDSFPKLEIKEEDEILDESLTKYWDSTWKDIISELNLKKMEESMNNFEKMKKEREKNEEIIQKIKHNDIICCNCFKKDFNGKRFICSQCENYNLCQECEKILYEKEIHQKEHVFIQIIKKMDNDNINYNNIIGNYQNEFQNVDEIFMFEFTVINNGENDLQNCYILPIRYGEDFLISEPKIINSSIKKGMNSKLSIVIKIPKKSGYFEGYFRMFTPNGFPFGDFIYIKVLNEK